MNSILSKTFAAVVVTSALALTPATAAPAVHLSPGSLPDSAARIINVQNTPGSPQSGLDFQARGVYRHHSHRPHYRGHHRNWRHNRHHRHGRYYYRDRNNGAGIVGGLITGAIIGGVAANALGNRGGGSAHVRWCYDRYRSYRASDNTYQPYHGPRRPCVSPY